MTDTPQDNSPPKLTEIVLLQDIRDLIAKRLPENKPTNRSRKRIFWICAGLIILSCLDFETRNADMVVRPNSIITLQKLPYAEFPVIKGTLGDNALMFGALRVELRRDGWKYAGSQIELHQDGFDIETKMSPLTVQYPSRLRISPGPIRFDVDQNLILLRALQNHGIECDGHLIPLLQIVDRENYGEITIQLKPPIGFQRLKANIEKVFGLIF